MHVTFIGNPRDPADTCGRVSIGGIIFPLNIEVEVPDSPLFAKLRGNSHFTVRDAEAAPFPDLDEDPIDLKPSLIALAQEKGVKIDKRWSADKIAKALEEHA